MKKISYVIAAYYGNRRFVHPKLSNNPLFYIQTNLKYLNSQSLDIHKIYIVSSFDNAESTIEKNESVITDKEFIISELNKIANSDNRIILLERSNIGGSYHAWQLALHTDNGESDYVALFEDDYTLYDNDALKYMIQYWDETPDLFYLCQYWTKNIFIAHGWEILEHAAISNGIINNKMYNDIKEKHNIDFLLSSDKIMWLNQGTYMENFRIHGVKFKDITDKYSSIFANDICNIQEFGKPNGKKIIMPIVESFF